MPYPLGYVALLVTALAFCAALGADRRSRVEYREFGVIIAFTLACEMLFFHVPPFYHVAFEEVSVLMPTAPGFQTAIAVIALTALVQLVVVKAIQVLFYRLFFAMIINALGVFTALALSTAGIINVVWFVIFTGMMGGLIVVKAIFSALDDVIQSSRDVDDVAHRRDVLSLVRDEINRVTRLALQLFVALGASVGVSMSILYRGGQQSWTLPTHQVNGMRLVVGFGLFAIGLGFWILKPYLATFTKVRDYFAETTGSRRRLIS